MTSNSSQPLGDTVLDSLHPMGLVGQLIADRYRVVEPIGSGGMGSVYRAEHIHMRKSVAIKVLHRELTHLPEMVARFEREAIAAARISHPNVATGTDFGRLPDGSCYLVLEYVKGRSLRQLLNQRGALHAVRACHIAHQIALALGAAHDAGIVHRDLKPENVMLVDSADGNPRVKVLDFGVAKIQMPEQSNQATLTRMGTVFGTPEYMSPEQALGQTADPRSDLYSLGIIIYEMLCGRTPFADKELVAILTRHMTEAPPPLPVDVDPALSALVIQLLAKRPSERPQTAQEVATRLEVFCDSSPDSRPSYVSSTALRNLDQALASLPSHPLETGGKEEAPPETYASRMSVPAWLRRTIRVGSRRIPLVLALLTGLAILVLALFAFSIATWSNARSSHATRPVSSAPLAKPSPSLAITVPDPLIVRARGGDMAAIRALEAQPPKRPTAGYWAALGRGNAFNKLWSAAIEAYGRAIDLDPNQANDADMIADVHAAAMEAESSMAAVKFAAQRMRASGADIVFDIWLLAASGKAPQADTRAAKKMMEDAHLRSQASTALKVALDLNDARGCAEYKRLLPQVISNGDDRCMRTLRRLTYDRGCGLFSLADCYSCLRGSPLLPQAMDATKTRPGPVFR